MIAISEEGTYDIMRLGMISQMRRSLTKIGAAVKIKWFS